MKKMLMLASVASMIDQFNMSNIDILRRHGYEVHVAANFEHGNTSTEQRVKEFKKELEELDIKYFHIDFSRNITDIKMNIKSYKQIRNLMLINKYDFVHCHSPIGGVCGRLAAHSTKTMVIYTAHGFHFFKGAPIKNWLLYYPIERWLARYTDVLITINKEDYARAKKSFKAGRVEYIPGVGLDTKKFGMKTVDKIVKRNELGIPENAKVLLSVGELSKRKNHEVVIKAIAKLNNPQIKYLVCGQGLLDSYLKELAKNYGVSKQVEFLGYRSDILEICAASDVFVFPSLQEGLPVALMEAMASGLPSVVSNIRGNIDLIKEGKGGYLCKPRNINGFAKAISLLTQDAEKRRSMGNYNLETIKQFDVEKVKSELLKIYHEQLGIVTVLQEGLAVERSSITCDTKTGYMNNN